MYAQYVCATIKICYFIMTYACRKAEAETSDGLYKSTHTRTYKTLYYMNCEIGRYRTANQYYPRL